VQGAALQGADCFAPTAKSLPSVNHSLRIETGVIMRLSSVRGALPLVLALCAGTASAATFNVSGFGTGGFTVTDKDEAEFVRASQPRGADSNADVGVDSIAGLQATAHLNDHLSATAQVLFRRRFERDFTLDVPLAFIKADITRNFAIRVGRVSLPVFLVSDFRQVGYASAWIRPPVEVYGQVPVDSVDGIDTLYSTSIGTVTLNAQAFYGKIDIELPGAEVDVGIRRLWGANLNASIGPLTLRAGRVEGRLTLDGPPAAQQLLTAVRSVGFTALADELSSDDRISSFTGFSAALDWHDIILQAEHTRAHIGGFTADTSGKYVLVGYRVGKFTPYAIHAERSVESARTSNVIPQVGPLLPLALGVNALIAGVEQNTTSFGVRWDAASSVAVKFQYDYVDPEGAGLFANVQPGFDGPVSVLGVAVDVVF
jgi:hypothetical protein